jgi:Ni/Fe-hydrogenase subunit HybB-like protein
MTIFESCMSSRAFRRGLELDLLEGLARVALVVLTVVLTLKIVDLSNRDALPLLFTARTETTFYWLELGLGWILPIILLSIPKIRSNRNGLFLSSVLIILGFVLNRMNISVTGMEAAAGVSYFPSWMEIAVTMMIVTVGFIVFTLAAKHLPVFAAHTTPDRPSAFPEHLEDLRTLSLSGGRA